MGSRRVGKLLAGVCCLAVSCGEPPDPPGAIVPGRVASAQGGSNGQVMVLDVRPNPTPPPRAPTSAPPDAGVTGVGASDSEDDPPSSSGTEPGSAERTFSACTASSATGCEYIYVAMQEDEADLCVQLTLDTCGSYGRQGLRVDMPPSWRLASGSVGRPASECLPATFYPTSLPVLTASGSINWNQDSSRPSQLVIDVTLETPAAATVGDALGSVTLNTDELVAPLRDCED